MTKFNQEKSAKKLAKAILSAKNFLVLLHDNPDPDCIASGLLLARISQVNNKDVTVAYGGHLGRSENITLVQSMKSRICHLNKINFDDFDLIALVDSQPRTGNNSLPENRSADIVIDHHPFSGHKATVITDIREDGGCTTVMAYNYLKSLNIELDKNLATAIIYAILTETQDLGRETTDKDLAVYLELFPLADLPLLSKIKHPKRPHTYFSDLKNAINNMYTEGTVVFSHLGKVNVTDIVPEICDLILEMDGIEWAMCTGHTNERIAISIRTINPEANLGELLKRVVGNKGKAGGHGMMAGGFIYLDEFSDVSYDNLVHDLSMGFLQETIKERKRIAESESINKNK
jgi:nanoRNase/pAp phosphatase (c-di-AMP/oligoRNAs hydrolase)